MKVCFIINPTAGKLQKEKNIETRVAHFAQKHNWDSSIKKTTHSGHATELSRNAIEDGCNLIVSIGGDGTMSEVAGELIGKNVIFGLIPCGSGNGLGRHLGIPLNFDYALKTLVEGKVVKLDVGYANEHPFFNLMGVGFDAYMGEKFNKLSKRGALSYFRATLPELFKYKPQPYRIHYNDKVISHDAWLVTIANSSQYGNNAYIAPKAKIDDGLLDLTLLHMKNFSAVPNVLFRLFNKTLDKSPSIIAEKSSEFIIETDSSEFFQRDGEIVPFMKYIHVRIKCAALNILVPKLDNHLIKS
jgi:diacylglycerol kinase (ATP)